MNTSFDPNPKILRKKKPQSEKPKEEEIKTMVGVKRGQMIVNGRNKAGMKQEELAFKLNMTKATLMRWEKGEEIFDKKHSKKIEEVLKIKFDEE